MKSDKLAIKVSTQEIRRVKSLQITKRLDALAGSFSFQCVSVPQLKVLADPFTEVDIFASGQVLLSGFIDRQTLNESSSGRVVSYSGRTHTAHLVDCDIMRGRQWINASPLDIMRQLTEAFPVEVKSEANFVPQKMPHYAVERDQSLGEVIRDLSSLAQCLTYTRGGKDLTLRPLGNASLKGEALPKSCWISRHISYDHSKRFHKYEAGGEVRFGPSESLPQASEALDLDVPQFRQKYFSKQTNLEWEASIRAAKAMKQSLTIPSWKSPSGNFWAHGDMILLDEGRLVIMGVRFDFSYEGSFSVLELCPEEALVPQPTKPKLRRFGA